MDKKFDVKEKIEELAERIQSDKNILDSFQKDPIRTIELKRSWRPLEPAIFWTALKNCFKRQKRTSKGTTEVVPFDVCFRREKTHRVGSTLC